MSQLGNFLGYQAVWFAAVYGAGRGSPWPALIAMLAFATWQLGRSQLRTQDLRLIGVALVLGVLLDGALSLSGTLHYAAAEPALPRGGAPAWILALWVSLALTLNHSLRYVRGHPLLAALLGALGGPLAYMAAGRLSQAVTFASPRLQALAWVAAGWAICLMVLAYLAGRWQSGSAAAPAAADEVS